MKLPDVNTNGTKLPVVELSERRILLTDGRYLIYFSGSIQPSSAEERAASEKENKGVRA